MTEPEDYMPPWRPRISPKDWFAEIRRVMDAQPEIEAKDIAKCAICGEPRAGGVLCAACRALASPQNGASNAPNIER